MSSAFIIPTDTTRAATASPTFTGEVGMPASTSGSAGVNLPVGTTPASPHDGDFWYASGHFYVCVGSTVYQLDQQSGGTANAINSATTAVNVSSSAAPSSGQALIATDSTHAAWQTLGTGGTVTATSVASANGFAGTVANPTTTPVISVSTTITGLLKGNGAAISAAGAGDFPNWGPADSGLKAWTYDVVAAANTSILTTAGVMYLGKIPVPVGTTISNVHCIVTTGGAGLTSAGMAVYQGGSLLAQTADLSTNFGTAIFKTIALTGAPISVTAGYLYVAVWANGTTLPILSRASGQTGSNALLSGSTSRFGTTATGITTTPPSTLGTITAGSLSYWFGVS